MAARKSCTHLTWAEAKGTVGGSSKSSSSKLVPKNIDHGKALTAKIIAKRGATKEELSKQKSLMRRAKRGEERAAAAAMKRAEEKERERMERMVRPYDLARERMIAMADGLQKKREEVVGTTPDGSSSDGDNGMHVTATNKQLMVECKELQVNELLGLEAIYNTTHDYEDEEDGDDNTTNKEFRIAESSKFDLLQRLVERWQSDPDDEGLIDEIVRHPPLSFTIQLVVDGKVHDDYFNDDGNGNGSELVALILLKVTLPSLYPSEAAEDSSNDYSAISAITPKFDVEYFVCTHGEMECTPDKPLETLGIVDEGGLQNALCEEAHQTLPDPCIYMMITACAAERLFEFVRLTDRGRFLLEEYLCRRKMQEEEDGES
eukprot:CAMPEP_0181126238 /NCGR_PEP_ID=MMETSP1071-20121207/27512_1 /TAXON_ID=35127 /ORGANISM="Thalassiosira sp., Strain NH16" /LENGTH=374 /DNA_ID=CAMNT_0023211805 /DNA_START=143 /DNA_END=1267 /DNA_ORIENTATION=+